MTWQAVVVVSFLMITRTATSAADCDANEKPYVDKEFVILKSTPSFKEAAQSAADAAAALGVKLNLRGLSPDLRTGLTFSREKCAQSQIRYPCYVPRGRRDDSTFASVEWSTEYELFAKGLYVVMLASGAPGSSKTRSMLAAARRVYPDAYSKRAKVYVGCMH